MTDAKRRSFFTLVFALALYVAGASFVQSFVNYPSWALIGPGEFRAYHHQMESRIIPFMVIPWFVEIICIFALMWLRPLEVRLGAIVAVQAFNLIALASTILIQIPLQIELGDQGISPAVLERLIATDPIRWISLVCKLALYLWIMLRLVNTPNSLVEPVTKRIKINPPPAGSHGVKARA